MTQFLMMFKTIVQAKGTQEIEESEGNDKNKEVPPVSVKKAVDVLKTFVNFFEWNYSEFDVDGLCIFRIVRVKFKKVEYTCNKIRLDTE
ncbi:9032_t:CDS:2 [Funneliformis caledonium]|uniref:9032_t:CDS:1 n=1 Tax=Funneliformis caledonium TaxID=1117310 RepID=A0A9N9EYN1_9GLOM|nr:9032_t:CDS:2 [Funneliformis caledonium]